MALTQEAVPSMDVAMLPKILGATLVLLAAMQAPGPARAQTDITEALLSLPGVSEAIAGVCDRVCAGNERRSWLHNASLDASGRLRLELRLRSRHVPLQGVVIYDDTAHLSAEATVLLLRCEISDWRIASNNDVYAALLPIFEGDIATGIGDLKERCREDLGL